MRYFYNYKNDFCSVMLNFAVSICVRIIRNFRGRVLARFGYSLAYPLRSTTHVATILIREKCLYVDTYIQNKAVKCHKSQRFRQASIN